MEVMRMGEAKTVLLTGASGAIGAEVARRLAAEGTRLALSGRREVRLNALADQIAVQIADRPLVLTADLGRRGEAARLAERMLEACGGVDVLINNAGASLQALVWVGGDRDEAREVFETNFWSPMALASRLAPSMLERGAGAIVNVGSLARVSPYPHLGHYAASRSALSLATEVLQMELGPRGVRVVEVGLGPVDTPSSRENRALAGADAWLDGRPGLGEVEAAAAAIAAAADGNAQGPVFYPQVLRWVHRFPGLGRRYARRAAKGADLYDEAVRFGGSAGAADLLALRNKWADSETDAAGGGEPY
jgi:short-subunit dehydrogenase